MAYTKTTWVNGASPAINSINLNKIETGIYDAHNLLLDRTLLNAAGDIIYAASNDTPARLAIGTARKHLGVNAGATAPEWVDSPQSLMTATGDTLYASSPNTPARLAIGTARKHLGVNAGATAPEWVDSPQSLMTAPGDILYASGAYTPASRSIGTAGKCLTSRGGYPQWERPNPYVYTPSNTQQLLRATEVNVTTASYSTVASFRLNYRGKFRIICNMKRSDTSTIYGRIIQEQYNTSWTIETVILTSADFAVGSTTYVSVTADTANYHVPYFMDGRYGEPQYIHVQCKVAGGTGAAIKDIQICYDATEQIEGFY